MRGPHVRFCERRDGAIHRAYSTLIVRVFDPRTHQKGAARRIGIFEDLAGEAELGQDRLDDLVQVAIKLWALLGVLAFGFYRDQPAEIFQEIAAVEIRFGSFNRAIACWHGDEVLWLRVQSVR